MRAFPASGGRGPAERRRVRQQAGSVNLDSDGKKRGDGALKQPETRGAGMANRR